MPAGIMGATTDFRRRQTYVLRRVSDRSRVFPRACDVRRLQHVQIGSLGCRPLLSAIPVPADRPRSEPDASSSKLQLLCEATFGLLFRLAFARARAAIVDSTPFQQNDQGLS